MDLDLALVRAFVVTADELHFGRAADRLSLTQQALSKRIRRLEDALGAQLFVRSTRTAGLTEAGRRFLPPAKETLAAAEKAIAAVHRTDRPLRVDVLLEQLAPGRLVREVLQQDPALRLELSSRRSMSVALAALARNEIDVAFGRIHDHGESVGNDLAHELVRLEPLLAIVPSDHPAARRDTLPLADLRKWGMWVPSPGTALEWTSYLRRLADRYDIPVSFTDVGGVSVDDIVARGLAGGSAGGSAGGEPAASAERPARTDVFVTGADVRNPDEAGLAVLPLVDPVPVYPWSVVWRRKDPHPVLKQLLEAIREARSRLRWRVYLPDGNWLPDVDLASIGSPDRSGAPAAATAKSPSDRSSSGSGGGSG